MNYTIHNMDCLSWMKQQPDASIDIIVSSPPYNIGIAYNTYSDALEHEQYLDWQRTVWNEACRILKDDGHLFINIGPTRKQPLLPYQVASLVPWTIQNSIVWSKCIQYGQHVSGHGQVTPSVRYLPNGHEMMFHFTKSGNTPIDIAAISVPYKPEYAESNTRRTGKTTRPTVNNWYIPYQTIGGVESSRTTSIKGNKKHPAIFPRELVKRCLRMAGVADNRIVYDPFAGTGTTILAAKELGMLGVGTELDADYCAFANSRMK